MREDCEVSDEAIKLGHQGRHEIVRRHNERAVLRAIYDSGPSSRAAIAASTGLSKPTAGALLENLAEQGHLRTATELIEGRERQTFHFSDGIGLALGIEIGASFVRGALTDITGNRSIEPVALPTPTDRNDLVDVVRNVFSEVHTRAGSRAEDVKTLTLAVPGSLTDSGAAIALSPTVPSLEGLQLTRRLQLGDEVEIAIENDANLAALGEGWRGAAFPSKNYAAVYLAAGVGMGIVSDGHILRGARGFAGEIAYLPIGADLHDPEVHERGALEVAVANADVRSNAELIPLLARTILSVHAILDPELVVLGGARAASPGLIEGVRSAVRAIVPFEVRIEASPLGTDAVLIGAVADARLHLLNTVLG